MRRCEIASSQRVRHSFESHSLRQIPIEVTCLLAASSQPPKDPPKQLSSVSRGAAATPGRARRWRWALLCRVVHSLKRRRGAAGPRATSAGSASRFPGTSCSAISSGPLMASYTAFTNPGYERADTGAQSRHDASHSSAGQSRQPLAGAAEVEPMCDASPHEEAQLLARVTVLELAVGMMIRDSMLQAALRGG